MGRSEQSVGKKGSKKWIQKLVDERPELLNSYIRRDLSLDSCEEIKWFSPLKRNGYAEYSDRDFAVLLGFSKRIDFERFWPKRGPQWDALGKSATGKLLLVEAKSHIGELISTMRAENIESQKKIRSCFKEVKRYLRVRSGADWCSGFYQYSNRLAHLCFLRQNELHAYLIFVYFLNDSEVNGSKTIDEWKGALTLMKSYLGIRRHKMQRHVTDIFVDIVDLQ